SKLKTLMAMSLVCLSLSFGTGLIVRAGAIAPSDQGNDQSTPRQVNLVPKKPAPNPPIEAPSADDNDPLPAGAPARLGQVRFKNLGRPYSLAFGRDSKTLACGTWDGTLSYWNVKTRKPIFELEAHVGPIHAIAISRDGKTLASAGHDNEIRIWQLP